MDRNKVIRIVKNQIATWTSDPDVNINVYTDEFLKVYPDDVTNPIRLKFTMTGPEGTLWEGKKYDGYIQYGLGYPMSPPDIYFTSLFLHPNVYVRNDIWGKLCISILHEGIDPYGYEDSNSRWTPAHNIGTILRSSYALFYDPGCDSPANIDVANLYLKNQKELLRQINTN